LSTATPTESATEAARSDSLMPLGTVYCTATTYTRDVTSTAERSTPAACATLCTYCASLKSEAYFKPNLDLKDVIELDAAVVVAPVGEAVVEVALPVTLAVVVLLPVVLAALVVVVTFPLAAAAVLVAVELVDAVGSFVLEVEDSFEAAVVVGDVVLTSTGPPPSFPDVAAEVGAEEGAEVGATVGDGDAHTARCTNPRTKTRH